VKGNLFGLIMIVVYPKVAFEVKRDSHTFNSVQTCTVNNRNNMNSNKTKNFRVDLTVLDYKLPLFVQAGIIIVASIVFVVYFKCSYLRIKAEAEKREKEKPKTSTNL
jgi:hypothetical protein